MRGEFLTPLVVELIDDGLWRLDKKLIYVSDEGGVFEVPAGFVTDMASVPRLPLAYILAGNTAHAAAVLHDFFYQTKPISRDDADEIFLEAMAATGVSWWRRWLMYAAVRSAGWVAWSQSEERKAELQRRVARVM